MVSTESQLALGSQINHRKEVTLKMALVRWDPLREMDSLQADVNRMFDRFFSARSGNGSAAGRWIPAMDLAETDDHLVLRADLPGMTEDDVEIEIQDGVLTVSGERKSEHEEKGEGFHRVERSFGRFSRSLTLPQGTDAGQVDAKFDHGVLEVPVPKPAESKPTRVQIGKGSVEGTGTEKE
jgi:HSP20 family protein